MNNTLENVIEFLERFETFSMPVANKHAANLINDIRQFRNEIIIWSTDDFIGLDKPGWSITEEQTQKALEDMINSHDCSLGITWDTLDYYYETYGTFSQEAYDNYEEPYEEDDGYEGDYPRYDTEER